MLLDEAPATARPFSPKLGIPQTNLPQLIHECIDNFRIASDRDTVTRIANSLKTLVASHKARLSKVSKALEQKTRQLHKLEQQQEIASSAHDSRAHDAEMDRLDKEKFRCAKGARDAEGEAEKLEGDARRLGVEKESLNGEVEEEGREIEVTKSKLYRGLRTEIEADGSGQYMRAVIWDVPQGKASVLELDPLKPLSAYTNEYWQRG